MYLYFFITLIVSVIITQIVPKLGIVDHPVERKIHTSPVPQGGGLSFVLPFIVILPIIALDKPYFLQTVCIVICTVLMAVIGLIDDISDVPAWLKLVGQIPVIIYSIAMGLVFDKFGVLNIPLTVLWYLGMINAMNLIDGLDGLASGIAAISCVGFGALAVITNNSLLLEMSILLFAGSIGFLVFNFNPAKIFMGDTGSLALGYIISIMGILAQKQSTNAPLDLAVPVLLIFIPAYNVFVCIFKRLLNGISLFMPDSTQTYNLIMKNTGATMRQTVLIYYFINALMICSAFVYLKLDDTQKFISGLIFVGICVAVTMVMGFTSSDHGLNSKVQKEQTNISQTMG